ncbi:MAG: hypothetical protein Q8P18_15880 [Pseudomonadota bacterium]|nr:hypothetical protein [Pseudomonadota bacterium]
MLPLILAASLTASFAHAKPVASSVAEDISGKHTADLALDGLLSTGWAEGGMGHGDGAWWEFDLASPTRLEVVSFWGGNLAEGKKSFREYARPKLVRVFIDGVQQGEKNEEGAFKGFRLQDELKRYDIPVDVAAAKKVRIEVVESFEGIVFADCYISEVAINFTEGERGRAVEKVDAWRASKEGAKLLEKHEADVVEAFTAHKADEDENVAMDFLMAAAGDGPTYLRKKVTSLVPEGYRAAAIVPDEKAMEAILKLKDPNGIPGLEMAALRSIGKQQKQIRENIEIFYAYQELKSGGRRSIDAWGEPGWEVGALRSYGEPAAIEIDRFGQIYVADVGNNRVQMFGQEGLPAKQWGSKPDISNLWFDGRRTWYAAGSGASEDQGSFVNPVDVELIPGKEADKFATLDATGRVQIFDEEGRPLIGWTVRVDHKMQPKVGGEGYLAWVPQKKQLVVFIGNTATVFTLDSEEVARWKVADGTPNAVETGKDGKLYLVFGSNVTQYGTDGFRYATVIGDDILGEGFEDVDLTKDEAGRLWALTDTGWVFNFKKPGKLDWKVKVSDIAFERPRFAVSQGMVFVTDRDRIVKADALQIRSDELDAKKAAAADAKAGKE